MIQVAARLESDDFSVVPSIALFGDILHSQGRYDQALLHLERHWQVHAGSLRLAQAYGMVLHDLGHHDAALPLFEFSIEARADDPFHQAIGYQHVGRLQLLRGDFDAADQALSAALALRVAGAGEDRYLWTRHWIANLQAIRGELQPAVTTLQDTCDVYEKRYSANSQLYAYASVDLAWALVASGELASAVTAFDHALSAFSNFEPEHFRAAEARLGLAAIASRLGDLAAAREHLRRARRQNPID